MKHILINFGTGSEDSIGCTFLNDEKAELAWIQLLNCFHHYIVTGEKSFFVFEPPDGDGVMAIDISRVAGIAFKNG